MKIFNLRYGFATNSSSTHSLIFNPDAKDDIEDYFFGWERWTAASIETRKAYVVGILHSNISYLYSDDVCESVIKDWCDFDVTKPTVDINVDHQSVYIIPFDFNHKGPSKEFFIDFKNFILQDNLVILGGNDNDSILHPLGEGFILGMPRDVSNRDWISRKDKKYGFWTLFNKKSGTKIRLSVDLEAATPQKALYPELVDLKISDYCPFNCSMCYQSSTTKGRHASFKDINAIIDALNDMQVFEIAIGGGEPTMHPGFIHILESISHYGIVPNFTTKSLNWLKNDSIRDAVSKHCGGFAFSVENSEDILQLVKALSEKKLECKHSVQYVMGTTDINSFEKILKTAYKYRIPITLLGYKSVGRGKDYKPQDYSKWLDVIEEMRHRAEYPKIGVDTALAEQFKDDILDVVDDYMVTFKEGKFSMYIDAVENKIGKSSYIEPSEMTSLKDNNNLLMNKAIAYSQYKEYYRVIKNTFASY